jgi:carbonyl reductase 1
VLLGCRDWEKGAEAVGMLNAEGVHNVRALHVDLDDASSIQTAAMEVHSEFGGLDVLVNNAAIALKGNTFTAADARCASSECMV